MPSKLYANKLGDNKPQEVAQIQEPPKGKKPRTEKQLAALEKAKAARAAKKAAAEDEKQKATETEAAATAEAERLAQEKAAKKAAQVEKRRAQRAEKKAQEGTLPIAGTGVQETSPPVTASETSEPTLPKPKRQRKVKETPATTHEDPPKWFMTFVEGVKREQVAQTGEKVKKADIKAQAEEQAKVTWNDGYTRDRIHHEQNKHLDKMYTMMFNNRKM